MPVIVQRLNYSNHNVNNNNNSNNSSSSNNPMSKSRVSFNNSLNKEISLNKLNDKPNYNECESLIVNIDKISGDNKTVSGKPVLINKTKNKVNKNIKKIKLKKKTRLFEKRQQLSDWSTFFALTGVLLMILETELTFATVINKVSSISRPPVVFN